MVRRDRGYLIEDSSSRTSSRPRRRSQSEFFITDDSQDQLTASEHRIEIRDGYPVRYKCMESFPNATANLMEVNFYYELSVSSSGQSSFAENLRAVEWSMLWNIVKDIGLQRCDFDQQSSAFERTRNLTLSTLGSQVSRSKNLEVDEELSQSYVLSLSSDEPDEVMTDSAAGSRCTHTAAQSQSSVCVPMIGSMKVLYTGNQNVWMQDFILQEIQSVVESKMVLVDDVTAVTFLGKDPPSADTSNPSDREGRVSNNFSVLSFIIIFVASSAAVCVLAAVVLRRKRRRVQIVKTTIGQLSFLETPCDDINLADTTSSEDTPSPDSEASRAAAAREIERVQARDHQQSGTLIVSELPSTRANSASVYLASKRQRRRKKGKKKKKTLRERVSLAPSGIDTIPEVEGDFDGALYRTEDDDYGSSDEEDIRLHHSFLGHYNPFRATSPPHSPRSSPTMQRRAFFGDSPPTVMDAECSIQGHSSNRHLPEPGI